MANFEPNNKTDSVCYLSRFDPLSTPQGQRGVSAAQVLVIEINNDIGFNFEAALNLLYTTVRLYNVSATENDFFVYRVSRGEMNIQN